MNQWEGMKSTNSNLAVNKVIEVLEYIACYGSAIGLTEISKKTGFNKATTHRMVSTLKDRGYLNQDEDTKKYCLGNKILELSHCALNQMRIRQIAIPVLKELTRECGETVHLGILDNGDVFYIDTYEGKKVLRVASHIGVRRPAHCSALGKVMLAFLPPEEQQLFFSRKTLGKYTEHTITGKQELLEHLKEIRRNGYALDNQELDNGTHCLAAPVRDHHGRIIAAISVSALVARVPLEKLKEFMPLIVQAAKDVSLGMGYSESLEYFK